MRRNQYQSYRLHTAAFGVAIITLLISLAIYVTRPNNFAETMPELSFQPQITNGYVLRDQLPSSVYNYTFARINDYLRTNNSLVASATIKDDLATSPDTYDFTISLMPEAQLFTVTVKVTNFSSILSAAVQINGQLQNPASPGQSQSDTQPSMQINGIDSLINAGITTLQANSLESAFQKFSAASSTVTIDPASITHMPTGPDRTTLAIVYTFNTTIDGGLYHAKLSCPDLSSVRLVLVNQANKQVFDSGTIASQ